MLSFSYHVSIFSPALFFLSADICLSLGCLLSGNVTCLNVILKTENFGCWDKKLKEVQYFHMSPLLPSLSFSFALFANLLDIGCNHSKVTCDIIVSVLPSLRNSWTISFSILFACVLGKWRSWRQTGARRQKIQSFSSN